VVHDPSGLRCTPRSVILTALVRSPGIAFGNLPLCSRVILRAEVQASTTDVLRDDTPWLSLTCVNCGPPTERFVSDVRAAASASGQQIEVLYVGSEREIETAFATLVQRGAGALVSGIGGFFVSQRERIVALAARHRIPAIYGQRDAVAAGGLMSYAPSIPDAYRQLGIYAGRILKGEKPGDLPVVLATKFELVINVNTAKALGLEIPDKLLALADEVIE
jgi:putative ABC transport system substrate-binding protein